MVWLAYERLQDARIDNTLSLWVPPSTAWFRDWGFVNLWRLHHIAFMDIYVDSTVLHSIASIYIYGHYSVRSRTLRLSYSHIWTLHNITHCVSRILVYGHYTTLFSYMDITTASESDSLLPVQVWCWGRIQAHVSAMNLCAHTFLHLSAPPGGANKQS